MTDPEWTGERRAAKLPAVTRDDVRGFLERAFRNIALPPLSADDVTDIAGGLSGFLAKHAALSAAGRVEELGAEVARHMALHDECGDFVTGEDGYVVFWPVENNGAYNSVNLRDIADELDRRNAAWDVRHYVANAPRCSGLHK